ncbi:MAG: metallophosphoesterase [Gemmatimonadota bacterium]
MKRIVTFGLLFACATACSESPTTAMDGARALSASKAVNESANPLDIAVIGDTPYGTAAIALFPAMVDAINSDPKVREVVHVGDFKSGSELCTDARFQTSADLFSTFKDPMVYAVGDNEWTDCHRSNNGGFNPLDRLAKVRELFYPVPGRVLGSRNMTVEAQANYPENQLWVESRVTFAVSHIIGSNNGLDKWFGDRKVNNISAPETAAEGANRVAEVTARQAANLAWLDHAFAVAKTQGSVGIVLFFQADLWHPGDRAGGAAFTAHEAWVARLSQLASTFNGKILLIGGDSHDYRVDPAVPWMSTYYGVPSPSNVTQIIVDRSIESPATDAAPQPASVIEWLRLHVDPRSPEVFSWQQVIVQ